MNTPLNELRLFTHFTLSQLYYPFAIAPSQIYFNSLIR